MKLIAISTLLILVLLSISSTLTHLYAESWSRHTPGFPDIESADTESLSYLLDLLKRLENLGSLNQVQESSELRSSIEESVERLSRAGVLKREEVAVIRKILTNRTSLNELINTIRDARVRYLLTRLADHYNRYGYVPYEYLKAVISAIKSLHDELDPEDYLLALEVLKRIANVIGARETATALDREALKALRDILASNHNQKLPPRIPQILNMAPNISIPQFETPLSELGLSFNIPTVTFPELALSSIPLPLLLLLLLSIAIPIALYIAMPKILPAMKRVLRSLRTSLTLHRGGLTIASERMSRVVELYWYAVERVSRVTGVVKRDVETHREYLKAVKERLGSLHMHFEEVTQGYEVVRFGGVDESKVIERVERSYRELVHSL